MSQPSERQRRPSLSPPPGGERGLDGFPEFRLGKARDLYRIGQSGRSPWWFGNSGAGRFDLPPPDGTCYTAADPQAALLEVVGPERLGGFVSPAFFNDRSLFLLHLPKTHRLADLAARAAAAFGITLEIHSTVPYELPQAWAKALRQAGFEGVHALLRHDPAGSRAYALFGLAGAREAWPIAGASPIDQPLLEQLRRETGIRVAAVPRLADITVAEAPRRPRRTKPA